MAVKVIASEETASSVYQYILLARLLTYWSSQVKVVVVVVSGMQL